MKVKMTPRMEASRMILQYMAILVKFEISKECAIQSCKNIIEVIDTELQGFCDADLISHYRSVIVEIQKYKL